MISACISDIEIRTVQDGVVNDVREDGRTLLQRRPVEISIGALDSSIGFEEFNGSSVEVDLSGTTVLATATPSVVEVCSHEADQQTDGKNPPSGGVGQLFISIDAVPSVLNFYACAIDGSNSARQRKIFLSHVALTIQNVFGAESVEAREETGVAEAKPANADNLAESATNGGDEVEANNEEEQSNVTPQRVATERSVNGAHNINCGFPARDLYIGKGYAFRIDVDVHVLQGAGGNLLSAIVIAVHSVLRKIKLPDVSLHQVTSSQVTVELDPSKPYGRPVNWMSLPLLAVLLLSPTRHYVVDPVPREELAIPQQLHVAANRDGQVCYVQYHQYPSARGNAYALRPSLTINSNGYPIEAEKLSTQDRDLKKTNRDDEQEEVYAKNSISNLNYDQDFFSFHLVECMAAIEDATHVCQAMIAECDATLEAVVESR